MRISPVLLCLWTVITGPVRAQFEYGEILGTVRDAIQAIETAGDIGSLAHRLRGLDQEISEIQQAIASHRPINVNKAVTDMRESVTQAMMSLRTSLAAGTDADVERAKKALSYHVGKLVLTPTLREGRSVYQVTGGVAIETDPAGCRIQLVATDGFPWHYRQLHLPLIGIQLDPRQNLPTP
jgi:hypothetical protein